MSDTRRKPIAEPAWRSSGEALNTYLVDPWACYEDEDSFCSERDSKFEQEETASDACCCC
jgi:hypothetical protein